LTVKDKDRDFGLKDKDFRRNWSQGQSKDFKGRLNSTKNYMTIFNLSK